MTFWYGSGYRSGSSDPYLRLTDPDSDPGCPKVEVIKKSQNSRNQGLCSYYFCLMMKDSDRDPSIRIRIRTSVYRIRIREVQKLTESQIRIRSTDSCCCFSRASSMSMWCLARPSRAQARSAPPIRRLSRRSGHASNTASSCDRRDINAGSSPRFKRSSQADSNFKFNIFFIRILQFIYYIKYYSSPATIRQFTYLSIWLRDIDICRHLFVSGETILYQHCRWQVNFLANMLNCIWTLFLPLLTKLK